ncbi:MAG TPA: LuxR C-terminal-related transcriptional regulator [Thermomicrobiales bacterium]|nr:LuxR C-terminal-related transcriptional regulator [Thermomicrobiales bacterium]
MLLTKLRAPRAAANEVIRPRLLAEIEQGVDRKLTLVVTPPGYGKSSLLSQWQSRTERASGWVTLDSADNDFFVFIGYVVAAIQSIDPCICLETASMLEAPSRPPMQTLIRTILNEVAESTRPYVLIFDDYYVITSSEVQSALLQFIQGMPSNMAVVIASRLEPELPTMKMIARGELRELGPADLSFNDAEVSQFLVEQQGLDLTATELEEIARWADGWPVALRLFSEIARGHSQDQISALLGELPQNVDMFGDYLWDEILENRSQEQRSFLLQTSILKEFNPELASAITGGGDFGVLLRNLARDNLFVSRLGGLGNWYRYHHLFAEVLRKRLHESVDESSLLELHSRAAAWYGEHGYVQEAANHAIKARDWEHAARYLIRICQEFYDQGRMSSLRSWLHDLPDEPFLLEPTLAYWLAWAELRSGHWQAAVRPTELGRSAVIALNDPRLEQTSDQLEVLRSLFNWDARGGQVRAKALLESLGPDQSADRSRTQIMLALLQETEGDLFGAEASLEEARVINSRLGMRAFHVLEHNVSADLLFAMGKLSEAAALYSRTIAIGDEWNDLPVLNAHLRLATIMLEWNRLEEAREGAAKAIDLATKLDTPIYLPISHAILSTLASIDQQWNLALDEIERAIAICADCGLFGYIAGFEERRCRIWLAVGQLTLAQGWLLQIGPTALTSTRYEDLDTTLTAIRVRIHESRGHEVAELLGRLQDLAVRSDWKHHLLPILLLRAVVENQRGDEATARSAIDAALELGANEGYLRSYLDEGPNVIPLLRMAAREHGPQRDYAMKLLELSGESVPQPLPQVPEVPAIISARERDVLRLVAEGLSNKGIGDALFVSEETVKTHLRRIFDKLEVSSRTQAIRRAQQLGLL